MGRRRTSRRASFAESLAQLPQSEPGAGQAVPVVDLAAEASFEDSSGVVWRRRGGEVTKSRLRKLLHDPSVRVLHDYMGETREVPPSEREAFWNTAQELMRRSPHSDFVGGEFKNESHERLLVLHEHC